MVLESDSAAIGLLLVTKERNNYGDKRGRGSIVEMTELETGGF